ncbi:MAG: Gldg family protein [Verrucomicrobiota bacterium]
MKKRSLSTNRKPQSQRGGARTAAILLTCAALAGGGFWYYRHQQTPPATTAADEPQFENLSASTQAVLDALNAPVQIRFYALLDAASVPESVRDFAGRVEKLLAAYEHQGHEQVTVVIHNRRSDLAQDAARADGISAFNSDKGDSCYLGLAVTQGDRRETFPRLQPEWEQALEFDLSRALAKLTTTTATVAATPRPAVNETVSVNDLKQALPNMATLSVEEGTRALRETALAEFKKTADEMGAQVKQAQERLAAAQNGQSDEEKQAAMKELQRVQQQHTEKLKEISARLQAQLATLQQIKKQ